MAELDKKFAELDFKIDWIQLSLLENLLKSTKIGSCKQDFYKRLTNFSPKVLLKWHIALFKYAPT